MLPIAGEQTQPEEQAEGVGVVVERCAARVIVRLDGPHVRMIRTWLEAVPIRAGLGIPHLLAELLRGEVPRAAALENALFEEEAAGDVDDDSAGALQEGIQAR